MSAAPWSDKRISALALVFLLLAAPVRAAGPEPPRGVAGEQTVAVGDVVLAYRILGQGKPLLLITGYGCTMDTWDPTLLAALSAHHRLILMDNRGMGLSTASATPFSLRLFADDAAGLLAALGIAKADVLGWSMGAMTALELALAHPDRVGRVAAYGTAATVAPVAAAIDRFKRLTAAAFAAQLFPKAWSEAHPDAVSQLPKPAMRPQPDIVRRQAAALTGWPGFGDRLHALDKDVLLVVGQEDTVTPPDQSRILADRIPGSWLIRFRNAGHWLMFQYPRTLAQVVEAFLEDRR